MKQVFKLFETGQAREAVKLIDEQVLYDFWDEYKNHILNMYVHKDIALSFFADHVITYFRIKSRRTHNEN